MRPPSESDGGILAGLRVIACPEARAGGSGPLRRPGPATATWLSSSMPMPHCRPGHDPVRHQPAGRRGARADCVAPRPRAPTNSETIIGRDGRMAPFTTLNRDQTGVAAGYPIIELIDDPGGGRMQRRGAGRALGGGRGGPARAGARRRCADVAADLMGELAQASSPRRSARTSSLRSSTMRSTPRRAWWSPLPMPSGDVWSRSARCGTLATCPCASISPRWRSASTPTRSCARSVHGRGGRSARACGRCSQVRSSCAGTGRNVSSPRVAVGAPRSRPGWTSPGCGPPASRSSPSSAKTSLARRGVPSDWVWGTPAHPSPRPSTFSASTR